MYKMKTDFLMVGIFAGSNRKNSREKFIKQIIDAVKLKKE